MFWKFVLGAVRLRRRRLALALCAMAVAGALSTAMFSVYSDVERKISVQFQGYGANVIIAPPEGSLTVPLKAAEKARQLGGIAAPVLYALNKELVLAGIDPARGGTLFQYWHVDGERGDCLAGAATGMKIGETLKLERYSCVVKGIVSTGGVEDHQIVLPFETVSRIAGLTNVASVIEVRMPLARLDALRKAVPDADVRTVQAVAATESNVVWKMRASLFLLTAVILVIVTISVSSNFGELVMERSKEIGILKAIGAGDGKIAGFFVAEALLMALVATLAGYAGGVVLAGWVDQSVFDAAFRIHLDVRVLFLAAAVTIAVAMAATGLTAGRIRSIQPAVILRGE
jgi:putative ABC transport system permease protein